MINDFTVKEKQRQIDMENHQKLMMELAEQEKLLKKLLSELWTYK